MAVKKMTGRMDDKQDAKVMKKMTPAQKSAFKKADMKMDRNKKLTPAKDAKLDRAVAKKVMAKKKAK